MKKQRKTLHLSVPQLAQKLNVSPWVVYKWERALTVPRLSNVHRLARALHVKVSVLWHEDEEESPRNVFDARIFVVARIDRGWTQKEVAARLGIDPSTVTRWNDGATPRPEHLRAIAKLFRMRVREFYKEEQGVSI